MSLIVTETRVVDPEVSDCMCGGIPEHSSDQLSGYSNGSASVCCPDCGLSMEESTSDLGFGASLESIYLTVVLRWNNIMGKNSH